MKSSKRVLWIFAVVLILTLATWFVAARLPGDVPVDPDCPDCVEPCPFPPGCNP